MCPLHVIRKLKADRVSGSFNTEGTHLPTVVKSNKTNEHKDYRKQGNFHCSCYVVFLFSFTCRQPCLVSETRELHPLLSSSLPADSPPSMELNGLPRWKTIVLGNVCSQFYFSKGRCTR